MEEDMNTMMDMGPPSGMMPEGVSISVPGVITEEDLQLLEALAQEAKRMQSEKQQALDSLAQEIEGTLRTRMGQRSTKEAEWITAQDLYMGKLASTRSAYLFPENDSQRQENVNGKGKYRVNIVRPKIDAVVAQLYSAQFGGGEKNWNLLPSRVPEIDTNIDPTQGVKRMEDVIEDQLEETCYAREYKRAIETMAVLGTGILKGPVNAGRLKKVWQQEQDPVTGAIIRKPTLLPEYIPCVKWVDPWFFFPDHTVPRIDDASDAIEVHPMSKRDLQRLQNHPGYISEAITKILEEAPKEFMQAKLAPTQAFANSDLFKDKYLVIERHGPVDQDCLCKIGIDLPFSEERSTYWAEVWVCNGAVIRIELSNLETADSVPYAVDVWEEDPASIFGFGLPLLVEDQQRISDGIWNAVVMNAKLTSGPQVGINRAMIQPMKDGSHDIEPWKVWAINEFGANINQAIQFFDVPSRQQELAAVLQMAKGFADEEASIPPLLAGQEAPQLSSGATGAAMVYKNATSMLHARAQQLDDNITNKVIGWMYDWNMQYNEDETIKGDYEVDVVSSTSFLRQQMEMINLEKLINQASQNPELAKVLKMDEAAKALIANLQLPSNKLVRNAEEVKQYEQQQQQNQQPDPKMLEMQIKQQELELEKQRLGLEEKKLQFEQTLNQERARMEYQERMEANDARIAEAQATVIKEQTKRDTAMVNYASRTQMDQAALAAKINIAQRDQDIKEFEIGAKAELDANKQALVNKELDLKAKTGSGI
jgi:hypothetical protein